MTENATDSKEPATSGGEPHLSGRMGVVGLVMSVLAFSSPLTVCAGFVAVVLTFSGPSAPGVFIVLTVMLLFFCVGFVKMSSTVENPGGFYSFVTAGLGKPAGLGGALLALVGYVAIGYFAPPLFALTAQGFMADRLHGPHIAWYWYGLALIAITTVLAYRGIDLSAKVLTAVVLLESSLVVVFDVASFATVGDRAAQSISFTMPALGDSGLGLALLFSIGAYFGFEATVIFREEVRHPDKTIPRATYIAVTSVGVFYAIAAWAYIAFFGTDNVQAIASKHTVTMFFDASSVLLGTIYTDVTNLLLMTSILASMLAIQNIAARYAFSLATDKVLPPVLGRVHPKHKSPFASSLTIGLCYAVATVLFVVLHISPEVLYPIASGSGTFAVMLLMLITSVAVLVYFARRRPPRVCLPRLQ